MNWGHIGLMMVVMAESYILFWLSHLYWQQRKRYFRQRKMIDILVFGEEGRNDVISEETTKKEAKAAQQEKHTARE